MKVPAPFHYQNDNAVPWRYACNVTTSGPLVVPICSGNTSQQTVNDITDIGGMTRSDRCYAPGLIEVGQEKENVKDTSTEIAVT